MKKVNGRGFNLVKPKPLWGSLTLSTRFNKIICLSYCMATEATDNQFTLLQNCKLFLLNLSRQSYILVSSKGKVHAFLANYLPSYPRMLIFHFNDDFNDGHSIFCPCVFGKDIFPFNMENAIGLKKKSVFRELQQNQDYVMSWSGSWSFWCKCTIRTNYFE